MQTLKKRFLRDIESSLKIHYIWILNLTSVLTQPDVRLVKHALNEQPFEFKTLNFILEPPRSVQVHRSSKENISVI